MKISSLAIKNIRAHADTVIPLDHINIFVGPEGAGKTTIKASIEQLLNGRCQFTGTRGEESEELIRDGAKKGLISAQMKPLGTVTRHIPNGLEIQAMTGSLTALQNAIYDHLKVNADVISAVMNTDRFAMMTSDEQKKMLFALFKFSFTLESLEKDLAAYLGKAGYASDLEHSVKKLFSKLCPNDINGGSEVLDALYKVFYEGRRVAKGTLEELKTLASSNAGPPLPEGVTLESKPGLVDKLAKLKFRQKELLTKIGAAQANINNRDRLVKSMETNRQELAVAEKQLNELVVEDPEKYAADFAEAKKKLDEAVVKFDAAATRKTEADAAVTALAKAMGVLYESTGDCPLAPGGVIKCAMTEEQKKQLLNKMDGDITKLKSARVKAEKASTEAQKLVADLDEQCSQLMKKKVAASQSVAESEQLQKLISSLAKKINDDMAEFKDLGAIEDVKAMETELAELDSRIPVGESYLQAIITEETLASSRKERDEKIKDLESRVECLEILVSAFSPKGIKAAKLGSVLDKIQAKANECSKILTGGRFEIRLDTSEDFDILYTKQGCKPRKFKKLSGSEQMQMGIIWQIILSLLTGLKFLAVDSAEGLGQRVKGELLKMLMKIKDEFDTILVFSILGEVLPVNPGIPGLTMFEVNEGTVTPIPVVEKIRGEVA